MGRYDDIDSPDYNDTNMGIGAYYDSPEEKQIARLEKKLNALTAERDRLAAENAELLQACDDFSKELSVQYQLELESKCHGDLEKSHAIMVQVVAERDATLDRLRGVVPKVLPPHMSWKDSLDGARSILYPPETTDDDR